jgi:LPXTG-motif cell wall-anchored protein
VSRLAVAVAMAGVAWLAPMGAQATKSTTTTTTTSTTTTSTTLPPTTVPETTTVPESTVVVPDGCVIGDFGPICPGPSTTTTLAPWQVEGLTPTDVCIQHITSGPTLQPGEFEYAASFSDSTGTTQRLILPCRPTSSPSPAVTVVSPPVLPATGGETGWIALVALVTLLTGISVVATVRRSS